ncbi:D-arabinono-1,4-lactone oxidase [Spirosoma soli]|uniref:D-arabinono-1,4-lactone oxidase n=1 Tax=Spirosoma soli TaxID=1770529 RepID=A0ABW5M0R1_9BACT
MTAPIASSSPTDLSSDDRLKNWSGNYTYSTDYVYSAESMEQVQEFVRNQPRLKVLGTRHCFNGIADSNTQFLSIRQMNQGLVLDAEARTVTVDASMSYGQLSPYLDSQGFALHNLASLPHISIAGACATATHGSGIRNGNLATAVSALELVTASGDILTLSRKKDGEIFQAVVVNLGALGVVTRITLDIQPSFQVQQYVYEGLPLNQLEDHFETIMAIGYSVSLFTDWQHQRISEAWIKRRVENGVAPGAESEFFGATLATQNLHPIANISAENCTEQMGVPGPWYDRLPHFRMGFTPSSGKELQTEYFVPRHHAVEAILTVERLRNLISPHLLISELRTIDADTLWMSPCYKQPSLAIHFTWKPDWPSVKKVLPVIEQALEPFQARPHWGKLFTMSPSIVQSRYEKLPDFKELVQQYDPQGKFRNEFLQTNLYS